MINPVTITLTSDGIDRHLSINPVYQQSAPGHPFIHTDQFLIYEDITPFEGMTDSDLAEHLLKTALPDYDPQEDLLYLGAVVFTHSRRNWAWEGKPPGFSGQEMEVLINYIAEYADAREEELNNNLEILQSYRDAAEYPPDTFTITILLGGRLQECTVNNWGESFEVQINHTHVRLAIDENLIWRQTEGQPLPLSLVDEIGYKINSYYE
jgi:hypothetical protein